MRYTLGMLGVLMLLPSFVFAQTEGNIASYFANKKFDSKTISAFLKAAETGNQKLVSEYLAKNPSIANVSDDKGNTALMYAAQKHNISLIKLLNKKGAKVNTTNKEGNSALCLALFSAPYTCPHGNCKLDEQKILPTLHLLINLNAKVDVSCKKKAWAAGWNTVEKFTPLHYAVLRPMPAVVEALIHYGADVNKPVSLIYSMDMSLQKVPPIELLFYIKTDFMATPEANAQIVTSLLNANAKFKRFSPQVLLEDSAKGIDDDYAEVLDVLLTRNVIPGDINSYEFDRGNVLTESVCFGTTLSKVKVLVKHGAKVTDKEEIETMLQCANEHRTNPESEEIWHQEYQGIVAYLDQLGYK